MSTKAYFIGLGGCGLETVSELSKKFGPQDPSNPEYLFTYIDTDGKTLDRINADGMVICSQDFINLGDTNPYQTYKKNIGNKSPEAVRLKEWMIEQGKGHGFTLSNTRLSDGAGAERMVGRTAMFFKYNTIETELRRKVSVFQNNRNNDGKTVDPDIWVFASSCGGTGSSLTLDTLYMINRLVNQTTGAAPNLKLVLFMPEPFIEANNGNMLYSLNAFSYMWELNAFRLDHKKGKGDRFKRFAVMPYEGGTGEWDLYKYIIPVDVETNFNTKIPLESLYATVAEMVYYLNKGNASDSMIGKLCNDIKKINGVTSHDETPFEWTQSLIPCGYHVLKKANKEFKEYIKIRGIYEVLKYGLLGVDIPDDTAIRDRVKKEFSREYILSNLLDLAQEDCTANVNSLQAMVYAKYDEIRKPSGEGFDKIKGNGFLSQLDSVKEEFTAIKEDALHQLKNSINQGISKTIKNHGLLYTWTVLNLVDDFYLEPLCKDVLVSIRKDRDELVQRKRSECLRFFSGEITKKNTPAVLKLLEEYRNALKEYYTVSLSIELIQQLTEFPEGYLELIRKGKGNTTGLKQLIEKTTELYGTWEDAYRKLAKEFRETDNDALTIYLPNLRDIATGNNCDWSADNMFDRLYYSTVLDYDQTISGVDKRVPVRKNEGQNNLATYIEAIDYSSNVFIELALSDVFEFKKVFEQKIIQPLSNAVLKVIEKDGTLAKSWLDKTLEESLDDSDMLPAGMTKQEFLSKLANKDRIPVLYPTTAGATVPGILRYLYAGASKTLAVQLGYVDNDSNSQFVVDSQMEDRFLIFKIPVGLDFFSYKYFMDIQAQYTKVQKDIKEGEYGCHIHKEFAALDLDKAVATLETSTAQSYLYYFFKSLYYQNVIYQLKNKRNDIYKQIFGQYSINDVLGGNSFLNENEVEEDIIDLSMFGDNSATEEEESIVSWESSNIQDTFIHVDISRQRVAITLRELKQKDNEKVIEIDNTDFSFELTKLLPCVSFARNLAENNCLDMLKSVDVLEGYLNSDKNISDAVKEVSAEAKKEIMKKGTSKEPKFAVFIEAWIKQKKNEDQLLLKLISESISKF